MKIKACFCKFEQLVDFCCNYVVRSRFICVLVDFGVTHINYHAICIEISSLYFGHLNIEDIKCCKWTFCKLKHRVHTSNERVEQNFAISQWRAKKLFSRAHDYGNRTISRKSIGKITLLCYKQIPSIAY